MMADHIEIRSDGEALGSIPLDQITEIRYNTVSRNRGADFIKMPCPGEG
jgi:hypothetical protein